MSQNDLLISCSLPDPSAHFCFQKDEFLTESFSVDQFITRHQRSMPLEQLKEDLSIYLRSLRLALIDLLNQDYADFINLSSNLMGLDQKIDDLITPLQSLKNDLEQDEQRLRQTIEQAEVKQNQLNHCRHNRQQLQFLVYVQDLLQRTEHTLQQPTSYERMVADDRQWIANDTIERLAFQMFEAELKLKRLTIFTDHIQQHRLIDQVHRSVVTITQLLESRFSQALHDGDLETLAFVLQTYATSQKLSLLQAYFVARHVKPLIYPIACDDFIDKSTVSHLFAKLVALVQPNFGPLIQLRLAHVDVEQFLLQTLWKEICLNLTVNAGNLFQAGNADRFHQNYHELDRFVRSFADCTTISMSKVLTNVDCLQLRKKFNTKIYFHMRTREALTSLEQPFTCGYTINLDKGEPEVIVHITGSVLTIIQHCWSAEIYIDSLFYDFWKFTLQLLLKFTLYLKRFQLPTSDRQTDDEQRATSLAVLTQLNNESTYLCNLVKQFCIETIIVKRPKACNEIKLINCLNETLATVHNDGLPSLQTTIKSLLIDQCTLLLQQIKDLPRLFRKTNREIPNRASAYVESCSQLLKRLTIVKSVPSQLIMDVLDRVAIQFYSLVNEVLTSVQKMEESLKRLKKVQNQTGGRRQEGWTMSDEDKIRLQLNVDVKHFAAEIEKNLSIKIGNMAKFGQLLELVKPFGN